MWDCVESFSFLTKHAGMKCTHSYGNIKLWMASLRSKAEDASNSQSLTSIWSLDWQYFTSWIKHVHLLLSHTCICCNQVMHCLHAFQRFKLEPGYWFSDQEFGNAWYRNRISSKSIFLVPTFKMESNLSKFSHIRFMATCNPHVYNHT